MRKQLLVLIMVSLLTSCSDTNEEIDFIPNRLKSSRDLRAVYDDKYVEWDSVEYFSYRIQEDVVRHDLIVPWASGSTGSLGIPYEWIDMDCLNPDASKRKYSRKNGWRMVFSNLMESGATDKYVIMYNRYTGMLRLYFRKIEPRSPSETSTISMGLGVVGESALLNFCQDMPKSISERQNNMTVLYTPSNQMFGTNTGFIPDQWYGMEIECAFDPKSEANNAFVMQLIGSTISNTTTAGGITGNITGNVVTTYSNVGGGASDFKFSFDASHKNTITQTYNGASESIGDAIENGMKSSKSSFWNGIWNNVKKQVPNLAGQTVKEGVKAIFSAGGSLVTKSLGSLAKSIFGISNKPMSSMSKVDLGANLVLNSTAITETSVHIGSISPITLPEYETSPNLFHERLGVWNLETAPTVYVDMYGYSYFYKQNPDKSKSVGNQPAFVYYVSPVTLMINPAIRDEFRVENLKQEIAIDENVNKLNPEGLVLSEHKPYGVLGDKLLYSSDSGTVKYWDFALKGTDRDFNAELYFNKCWPDGLNNIKGYLYCRVSFDLVSKADGSVYSFSKYFKVENFVKRNFYHSNVEI